MASSGTAVASNRAEPTTSTAAFGAVSLAQTASLAAIRPNCFFLVRSASPGRDDFVSEGLINTNQAAFFQTIKQRIKRCDVESQYTMRALLD